MLCASLPVIVLCASLPVIVLCAELLGFAELYSSLYYTGSEDFQVQSRQAPPIQAGNTLPSLPSTSDGDGRVGSPAASGATGGGTAGAAAGGTAASGADGGSGASARSRHDNMPPPPTARASVTEENVYSVVLHHDELHTTDEVHDLLLSPAAYRACLTAALNKARAQQQLLDQSGLASNAVPTAGGESGESDEDVRARRTTVVEVDAPPSPQFQLLRGPAPAVPAPAQVPNVPPTGTQEQQRTTAGTIEELMRVFTQAQARAAAAAEAEAEDGGVGAETMLAGADEGGAGGGAAAANLFAGAFTQIADQMFGGLAGVDNDDDDDDDDIDDVDDNDDLDEIVDAMGYGGGLNRSRNRNRRSRTAMDRIPMAPPCTAEELQAAGSKVYFRTSNRLEALAVAEQVLMREIIKRVEEARTHPIATQEKNLPSKFTVSITTTHAMNCIMEQRLLSTLNWVEHIASLNDGVARLFCNTLDIGTLTRLLCCDVKLSKRLSQAFHNMLLSLMADQTFKVIIATAYCEAYRTFSTHYESGLGTISDSIYGVSVQFLNRDLFVNEVSYLYGFLENLLGSLRLMLNDAYKEAGAAVTLGADCGDDEHPGWDGALATAAGVLKHRILSKRRYNPILGDMKVCDICSSQMYIALSFYRAT